VTHNHAAHLIEQDIARDRENLAATLQALQSRLTVDTFAKNALQLLRANSAPMVKSIEVAVRANPLAAVLVGAGLAWLVLGSRRPVAPKRAKLEALSTWEDDGGPARPSDDLRSESMVAEGVASARSVGALATHATTGAHRTNGRSGSPLRG
jgi:Protein of unknown function (DUF3618)